MAPSNPHLETVLGYARRGWPVFPCHSAPDGECSCARNDNCKPGKHPRTAHGLKEATQDEGQIEAWLTQWPGCNWAVSTGPKSGVFVLDVDGEKGRASLAALESNYGPLLATLTTVTGGGEHRWFRYPVGRSVRNSQGNVAPALDVRANGGYVLVPPSVHANGTPYEWRDANAAIADAPDWLVELIAEPQAIKRAHEQGAHIPKGQRIPTLFREGCSLRGRGAEQAEIEATLLRMNDEECGEAHDISRIQLLARQICQQYPPGPVRMDASQPLHDFLQAARQKNNLEFMERDPREKWRSALFTLTRQVKGRPEFSGIDASQAARRIEQEVGVEFWEQFSYVHNDPKMQFTEEWDRVRTPAGNGDALTRAWDEARQCPMVASESHSAKYDQCISLLAALQRRAGEGNPIAVPQVRIGELLGVDYSTVGHYIKHAVRDKIASQAKKFVRRQRAAEYIIDLSKLALLSPPQSLSESLEVSELPETPRLIKTHQDSTGASGDSGRNENSCRSGDSVQEGEAVANAGCDFPQSENGKTAQLVEIL
jgi:hypothetical protein